MWVRHEGTCTRVLEGEPAEEVERRLFNQGQRARERAARGWCFRPRVAAACERIWFRYCECGRGGGSQSRFYEKGGRGDLLTMQFKIGGGRGYKWFRLICRLSFPPCLPVGLAVLTQQAPVPTTSQKMMLAFDHPQRRCANGGGPYASSRRTARDAAKSPLDDVSHPLRHRLIGVRRMATTERYSDTRLHVMTPSSPSMTTS